MNKTILFVEDDADDREFLSIAVHELDEAVNVVFAENGLKALEYLDKGKENEQLPCLIVLDLNMPYLDGKETFKKIKYDLKLDAVPIIIFTSSHNPNDRLLFTSMGVEFITKPDDFTYMSKIVRHMVNACR
jgi:CheY-like chemotaxis protein